MIKIERPGDGDFARGYDERVKGLASYFVWLNRSKESLTLDVKQPAGREILHGLLAGADVFVHNLGPGAAARLGVDAGPLCERYPRLVHCTVSGYGSTGPWADRKAYDLLVQCETGLVSLTGTPEVTAKVGISVADIAAGMYAYSGVLTGLLRRANTGAGSAFEVSLFEALAEWMGQPAYYTRYGGEQPARAGAQHATIAPYGPYVTGDGDTVVLAVQNEREWVALCRLVLGDEEVAHDPRFATNSARVTHREALNKLYADRFATLGTSEALRLLDAAGVASGRMNTVPDLLDHPVLAARGRWATVGSPGGDIQALLPPATFAGTRARLGPVPAVGEHTDAILRSLGRTDDDIARLRADHTV